MMTSISRLSNWIPCSAAVLGSMLVFLSFSCSVSAAELSSGEVSQAYQQHCSSCHHPDRLGNSGPALLPESLARTPLAKVVDTITKGRPATQMPAFGERLTPELITALGKMILTPLPTPPVWTMKEILESHRLLVNPQDLPATPQHKADPMNVFVVVEQGDHHMSILDGDKLEPMHRMPTRAALHGGPKFSADGRFVFTASRDGWISAIDLYSFQVIAEIRAGINSRNLALADPVPGVAPVLMVANFLPHTLVVLSVPDLRPLSVIPVVHGKESSRVSAVYTAAPRHSFIAALKDLPQVWEIPYAPQARPVITTLVHDYRQESGEPLPVAQEPFPVRRIRLENKVEDFFFDQNYTHLIGAARDASDGTTGQVIHLDVGRSIARLDIPGMPHLGSGITWPGRGTQLLATPNIQQAIVSIIDMQNWQVIKRVATGGPGFFMRSHEQSPYAWVDTMLGPEKDTVHILDKETLEIVKTLKPAPGKTTGHVEFTRDGRYALLSVQHADGALIVYDSHSLQEIKRLPMKHPVGKYNVFNKVTRSAGTSH
jgi:hypothetical protein